jgi:lactobin A/cerein 7B family class IIb bacteriocin
MENLLNLNKYGVAEMQSAEMEQTEGGVNPWLFAIGSAYAVYAIANFVDGVYTGIKQEYIKDTQKKK